LIPLILVELWRDYFVKDKKRFPLHYVLIAGLAGLLPDIDVVIYWFLNGLGSVGLHEVHRTFTHSLFFPLIFLGLGFVFWRVKWGWLGRHKMELRCVFLIIAFGIFSHLFLDFLLCGFIMPFYPVSEWALGLNLFGDALEGTLVSGLDAVILAAWLVHEELKHKISGFF